MGNCLDRTISDDSADENILEDDLNNNNLNSENLNNLSAHQSGSNSESINNNSSNSTNRPRRHRNRSHRNGSRSSRYIEIIESSLPIRSSRLTGNSHNSNIPHSQSYVNNGFSSASFSSSPLNLSNSLGPSQQVYYLTPNVQRTADQLTEEDQIKLLKRMALIQQLPSGCYDENKKNKECVICMIDFEVNDTIKYLPCMHTFHQSCIDTWLVRSLICPSCMEPVDAGLLAAYE